MLSRNFAAFGFIYVFFAISGIFLVVPLNEGQVGTVIELELLLAAALLPFWRLRARAEESWLTILAGIFACPCPGTARERLAQPNFGFVFPAAWKSSLSHEAGGWCNSCNVITSISEH